MPVTCQNPQITSWNPRVTSPKIWKIFSTIWLWKISMWPLYYHHILAAGKLKRRFKGYYNNAINVRTFLGGDGSKIWKVNRCWPTVSNEAILATKQEFQGLLFKISPRTKNNWHCTIGFLINTAPLNVYFNSTLPFTFS